jgi:hypothetical protein
MKNQEQDLESPWDERTVRLEMREKCVGKFQSAEINQFFDKSVGPALTMFSQKFKEIIGPEADFFEITFGGGFDYHEGRDHIEERLEDDMYYMRDAGVQVTTKDRLFYYHVYATTPPIKSLGPPYCVFIKSDGEYRFINDLGACSKDALFQDVKRSFLEAKAQLES